MSSVRTRGFVWIKLILEACKKCIRPNGLAASSIGSKRDPAEGDFQEREKSSFSNSDYHCYLTSGTWVT